MKILIKSAWGSDDPTKAAFPFLHGNAFADAGHEVQIFLLGEGPFETYDPDPMVQTNALKVPIHV